MTGEGGTYMAWKPMAALPNDPGEGHPARIPEGILPAGTGQADVNVNGELGCRVCLSQAEDSKEIREWA